jgi:hypothetical protein
MTKPSPRRRTLHWGLPEPPTPKHPYRDTALVYGGLAVLVVVLAWVTGGSVGKGVVVAAVVFVAACAWSWARWHQRLRREQAHRETLEEEP